MPFSGMVDDQSSHHASRIPHESRPVGKRRAVARSHVQIRFVQEGCGAQARLQAALCEFTFGEPTQLGIKGSKRCFRGGFLPSFRCDNK